MANYSVTIDFENMRFDIFKTANTILAKDLFYNGIFSYKGKAFHSSFNFEYISIEYISKDNLLHSTKN